MKRFVFAALALSALTAVPAPAQQKLVQVKDTLALLQFELSPEGQKMAEKEGFDTIGGDLVKKNESALK